MVIDYIIGKVIANDQYQNEEDPKGSAWEAHVVPCHANEFGKSLPEPSSERANVSAFIKCAVCGCCTVFVKRVISDC